MPTSPDETDRQINVDEYGRQINSDKNGRQTNVDKNGRKDNVEGNGLQIDVDEYDRPNKVDKKGRQHRADLLESVLSLGEQLRVYSSDFSELRSRLSQVETSLCQSERLNETSVYQPQRRLEETSVYQPECRNEKSVYQPECGLEENGIILKVLKPFCKATAAVVLNVLTFVSKLILVKC
jgi:murein L,D-transpeptidase YcbB/YkuD